MKPPPERVTLTSEEGEALIDRVYASDLPRPDCLVVAQIIRLYFWRMLALQEAKLSLKRFWRMLFGEGAKNQRASASEAPKEAPDCQLADVSATSEAHAVLPVQRSRGGHRPGQGRLGAEAYGGAIRRECRHEELAVGQRCPICGQGTLYEIPPGVEIRLDGHALLSAIRYAVQKLCCSACGEIFTASLPQEAGKEKYSARARAVLAVSRYYLGVPVPDATQWDVRHEVARVAVMT